MIKIDSSSAPDRSDMLRREVSSEDAAFLQKNVDFLRVFCATGKRFGFFQESSDSSAAGYAVPRFDMTPERSLASLVARLVQSGQDVSALAEQWEQSESAQPGTFYKLLLDEAERMGSEQKQRDQNRAGTLALDDARESLDVALARGIRGPELQRYLGIAHPPVEQTPDWYQVMMKYKLMPLDIDEILRWDPERPSGEDPDIISIQRGLKEGARKLA